MIKFLPDTNVFSKVFKGDLAVNANLSKISMP